TAPATHHPNARLSAHRTADSGSVFFNAFATLARESGCSESSHTLMYLSDHLCPGQVLGLWWCRRLLVAQ
ncbi:MAG: hypothetical protein ACTHNK_18445, partial [Thermomicrobiales bacterium]